MFFSFGNGIMALVVLAMVAWFGFTILGITGRDSTEHFRSLQILADNARQQVELGSKSGDVQVAYLAYQTYIQAQGAAVEALNQEGVRNQQHFFMIGQGFVAVLLLAVTALNVAITQWMVEEIHTARLDEADRAAADRADRLAEAARRAAEATPPRRPRRKPRAKPREK